MTCGDGFLIGSLCWVACGFGVWLSVLRWAGPIGRGAMTPCFWLMLLFLTAVGGPLSVVLHADDVMGDD